MHSHYEEIEETTTTTTTPATTNTTSPKRHNQTPPIFLDANNNMNDEALIKTKAAENATACSTSLELGGSGCGSNYEVFDEEKVSFAASSTSLSPSPSSHSLAYMTAAQVTNCMADSLSVQHFNTSLQHSYNTTNHNHNHLTSNNTLVSDSVAIVVPNNVDPVYF